MASAQIKFDAIELNANLAKLGPQIDKTLVLTTDFAATRAQATMKLKAPWTDRTGNARAGLWSSCEHSGTSAVGFSTHTITLGHSVSYGIWLEIANSGKYQIIMPTVLATGQETMKALQGMLNNLDRPVNPNMIISPNVNVPGQQGTSQGPTVIMQRQMRRGKRVVKRAIPGEDHSYYEDFTLLSALQAFPRVPVPFIHIVHRLTRHIVRRGFFL